MMGQRASLMRADGVRVDIDGRTIVDGVRLSVAAGEMAGLIGPNGAGKTTLLRVLAGVQPAAHGDVRVGDAPLLALRARERARRLAYVPQDTTLDFDFTAHDVVLMGRHPHVGRFEPLRPADYEVARTMLAEAGATRLAGQLVTTLSGGERQLVHLAKALAHEPDVLLLDEPVAALDLRHQLQVLGLLRRQATRGLAVVAVLHDLEHAARFCDRLFLLDGGRLVAAGTPREVLTEKTLADVYGVRAVVDDDVATGALRVTALDVMSGPQADARPDRA
ncbi:ABC transporter ATP-binding protein [Actinobacteria bacterium YIM 96077]|uniref:Iron ABC transporter ATP-binding protein n=1 Tax=Phytoactinopolyspora halophila TaxID=1981511 RepID=A0A329QN43_9ACTN|nr:ABC transporter ATP-binding protein [Phytoactinopolyspora halophila]AYY12322.1 ABC transporter ATP-binding protein [Actinobacteria bacterium YIM 96077]RAW13760.1 iron ABC transporter ATP-binding protein [Phytoactinopolyspora halophila]